MFYYSQVISIKLKFCSALRRLCITDLGEVYLYGNVYCRTTRSSLTWKCVWLSYKQTNKSCSFLSSSFFHFFIFFFILERWGRAGDQKARRIADASSARGCGRGLFSQSQFSMQTLTWCSYSPVSNGTHQHLCAHTGSCTIDCTHTNMLLTLADMGSAAPATAIA